MKKCKRLLVVGLTLCLVVGLLSAFIVRAQSEATVSINALGEAAEGTDFIAGVDITGVTDFDDEL